MALTLIVLVTVFEHPVPPLPKKAIAESTSPSESTPAEIV